MTTNETFNMMKNATLNLLDRRLFAAFLLLFSLSIGNAWGGSSYYAKLRASVAESTGTGTVYVATPSTEATEAANDPSAHAASKDATSSNNSNTVFYFTAYATAARGSMFSSWSDLSGDGSPAVYADGGYTLNSNPIIVKVTSASSSGTNEATITANFVNNPVASWAVKFLPATNGTYTVTGPAGYDTPITLSTETTHTTYNNDDIKLVATPATGYVLYRYYGMDAEGNKFTLGELGAYTQTINLPEGTVAVGAEFTDKHYLAAENLHNTLNEAIQATRQNDGTYAGTILLIKDDELSAGYYTIPASVTLLIPVDGNQTKPRPIIERVDNQTLPTKAYKTLTLAEGCVLDVFGNIEVGGRQNCYTNVGTGRPQGATYGLIEMNGNSSIILEKGANLYAWGFVVGDGKIDARRGSSVHEQFQVYDWEGGSETSFYLIGNKYKVFVFNEYFIQNVESEVTYRPGSALYGYTGLKGIPVNQVKIIGVNGDAAAMFLMNNEDDSEDTWVRKKYQVSTDQQVYEINNAASLGNLRISASGVNFSSEDYILPITHNMKIHLLSGEMKITQHTVLLPGTEIEVDKEATANIVEGMGLYLFDYHEWDAHIHQNVFARRIECRPGGAPTEEIRPISSAEALGNAKLTIHGTFSTNGALYTTASGASITSTNPDAGTILFPNGATETVNPPLYTHKYSNTWNKITTTAALLRNEDTQHPTTETVGTPAGQSYCYMNNKWTMMTVDPTNKCFVYDNYGTYYAKPGAYVALANGKTENEDHTYSDADGEGRLFILMDECQWWEVVNEDNLYKGIVRDKDGVASPNGKYYEYNTSTNKWEEKRYTITWKDWDGSVISTYQLTYGTTPQYLSTNPTRDADVDYSYNFTGWTPAFTPVTGNQIYTATYSKEQIKYTIIFKFADSYLGGAEIDRQLLARDEMPAEPKIIRDGWYLKWTPAIGTVTGNATYEAEWMEELPDYYTITWKNYDGTTLTTTTPARDASAETVLEDAPANPEKPATSEYRYEFAGWKPAVGNATADATYTAQYNEIGQTYAIRFYDENGTQIGSTQNLSLGADPVVPAYSKDNTAEYTYQLQWKIKDTETIVGVSVPSVSAAVDYEADFISTKNRYTITAKSKVENEEGNVAGCTFTGTGTYDYGTEKMLTAIPNTGYEFVKWSDDVTDNPRNVTVSGNATYTAIVKPIELTVEIDAQKTIALPTTLAGLTISSNGDEQSSEVLGAENLSFVDGRSAYFDLQIDDTEPRHWHAFSVPFQVNLKKAGKPIQINGEPLTLGRGYDILFYDGAERAAHGKTDDCWKYVEDGDSTLYPGKAYMIASASRAINTVRFTAELDANGKLILADGLTVTAGSGADGGWNGIGNPNMYHSTIIAGPTFGYVHDGGKIGEDGYVEYNINNLKYVVGKAVYVQVEGSGTQPVVVNKAGGQGVIQPNLAPARRSASAKTNAQYLLLDDYYKISLSNDNGIKGSNVYVLDEKDKENKYVIGHDLAKMSMSNTRAQIWVERYNDKLSLNTTAPIDNQANYPLGIYAPKAGEYTISMPTQIESGKALYLTLDGEAIWNLSDGAYTISLEKGTTNHYGLRISAKAPQMPTDIDEAVVDAKGETQKVLIDNQVFIIRGNEAYTITGKKVN